MSCQPPLPLYWTKKKLKYFLWTLLSHTIDPICCQNICFWSLYHYLCLKTWFIVTMCSLWGQLKALILLTLIVLLMFLLDQELNPPANMLNCLFSVFQALVHHIWDAWPSVLQKGGVIQSTKMMIRPLTVMIQCCELTKALKWSCESCGRNSTFNNC